jgi:hypothetical protein
LANPDPTWSRPPEQDRASATVLLSRSTLPQGSVALLGALAGTATGGARLAATAQSGGSAAIDREILAFGRLIERLQAESYAAALRGGRLTGEARQLAQVVGAEEQAHVRFLSAALGARAGNGPRFRFGDAATDPAKFVATVISLEENGLGAYNGQAINLTPTTLAAAARVVSVEARHAGAAENLEFLIRRCHEPETSGVAGEEGDDE